MYIFYIKHIWILFHIFNVEDFDKFDQIQKISTFLQREICFTKTQVLKLASRSSAYLQTAVVSSFSSHAASYPRRIQ